MKKLAVVATFLIAFAAFGFASYAYIDGPPQWFTKGIFIGPDIGRSGSVTASTVNKLTAIRTTTKVYDFPAVASGAYISLPHCVDSATFALSGTTFGDPCIVGVDQTIPQEVQLQARVASAGNLVLKVCGGRADGGSDDLPDASYTVTCFSNH